MSVRPAGVDRVWVQPELRTCFELMGFYQVYTYSLLFDRHIPKWLRDRRARRAKFLRAHKGDVS